MGNKLDEEIIKKEFFEYIKSKNRKWKFISTEHQKYEIKNRNTFGRTWIIKFKCESNHINKISLSNFRKGTDCGKCKGLNLSIDDHIKLLEKVHNNYYTYEKFKKIGYKNSDQKIPIQCPKHELFYQTYSTHKAGSGCAICGGKKYPKGIQGKELIKLVAEYSRGFLSAVNIKKEKYYLGKEKYEVKCEVHSWHKNSFKKIRKLSRKTISCRFCKASKYELTAYHALHKLGVNFDIEKPIKYNDKEYGFVDIVIKNKKDEETFIEIDGEQHFNNNNWSKNKKEKLQNNLKVKYSDRKKNEYAKINNIKIYRIKFTEDIESSINKIIANGSYKKNHRADKNFPIGKISDEESKAYKIHKMFAKGISPKEIKAQMNVLGSYISKVLHGERFKNLFLYLYPSGKNIYYKKKRFKHIKLLKKERDYLIKQISKKDKYYPEIKLNFDKKFRKISINTIKNFAIKNNLKSKHWIELTKKDLKEMQKLRSQGTSLKEIARIFTEEKGIKISRPTVKAKLDHIV